MKVRWTDSSLRLRITPAELDALTQGQPIVTALEMPGGGWEAQVIPHDGPTFIHMARGELYVTLAPADIARLAAPDTEGVYFATEPEPIVRYYIEKDFPCVHPRAGEAEEVPTETFSPPPGFEDRKM